MVTDETARNLGSDPVRTLRLIMNKTEPHTIVYYAGRSIFSFLHFLFWCCDPALYLAESLISRLIIFERQILVGQSLEDLGIRVKQEVIGSLMHVLA